MRCEPLCFSPLLSDDDAHDGADREDEEDHADHGEDDEVGRVEARALGVGALAHPDEARSHGLQRLEERGLLHDALHQPLPPRPATSKKVYEMATVFTSLGSFGSM